MNNPLRYWRTGTIAVVLAALGSSGFADDAGALEKRPRQRFASPFGVDETVHRIESSARELGVAVFGCFEQRSGGAAIASGDAPGRGARVVVLESMQGGTPVLMAAQEDAGGDAIELPLSIRVRPAGGRSEVWVDAPDAAPDALQGLALDLAALDDVVHAALRT